jgi:hypothetical protein
MNNQFGHQNHQIGLSVSTFTSDTTIVIKTATETATIVVHELIFATVIACTTEFNLSKITT